MTSEPKSYPPAAGGPAKTEPPRLARVDSRAELERTLLALLPRVRSWLFRMLGPHGSLDDATQDVLIELARALPRFEGRSSVESFAYRITVRVSYRHFSRRAPALELDPEAHAHSGPLPDATLSERESLSRLHRCLEKLPPRRRTAFVLCAIEGLSPQEAAELVGTSPGSMRARFMHAREELARMLAPARAKGELP